MTQNSPTLKWFVVGLVTVVALFAWLGTAAEHLLLGWLYFPLRVVPQMTVDLPAALLGLAALVLLILVLHVTARWLIRATAAGGGAGRSWTGRSTFSVTVLLLLLFTSGTAMVGATHQVVWLLTGRQNRQNHDEPVLGILDRAWADNLKMQSENNLKQLAVGIHTYHDTWKSLPAGGTMTERGELLHGWAIAIGPQAGYVAEDLDYKAPWNQPPNDRYYKCNLYLFVNPSIPGPHFNERGFGLSHYAGNVHVMPIQIVGSSAGRPAARHDLSDGGANTLLIGTVINNFKPWGDPANLRDPMRGINQHPDGFGGPPGWGGAQFAMCDGSVRYFSDKTDTQVLARMATPSGGEAVETASAGENAR